jgi:hypothetical protein
MPKRSAQEVIDTTIHENRLNEYLNYVFAFFFVALGAYGFIHSVQVANGWLAAASAIESGLFYPAVNTCRKYVGKTRNLGCSKFR